MQSDIMNVLKHFTKAARSYDDYAEFQYFTAEKIVQTIINPPNHILDIGCGTGILTYLLRQKFPNTHFIMLDIAPLMLRRAKEKLGSSHIDYICGSGSDTNFIVNLVKQKNIDLIVSNLCFQWFDDPVAIFDIYKGYSPICISLLGSHSFYQWYEAIQSVSLTFKPPISIIEPRASYLNYAYHIHYKTGLNFLQSQKKLGTLNSKHNILSAQQIRQACYFFEKQHNGIISYFPSILANYPLWRA